jgi:hypothetical protein
MSVGAGTPCSTDKTLLRWGRDTPPDDCGDCAGSATPPPGGDSASSDEEDEEEARRGEEEETLCEE